MPTVREATHLVAAAVAIRLEARDFPPRTSLGVLPICFGTAAAAAAVAGGAGLSVAKTFT